MTIPSSPSAPQVDPPTQTVSAQGVPSAEAFGTPVVTFKHGEDELKHPKKYANFILADVNKRLVSKGYAAVLVDVIYRKLKRNAQKIARS